MAEAGKAIDKIPDARPAPGSHSQVAEPIPVSEVIPPGGPEALPFGWNQAKAAAAPAFTTTRLIGPFIRLGLVALVILIAIGFGRSFLDSLLIRLDQQRAVHADRSEARIDIHRSVPDRIALTYAQENGAVVRVLVDKAEYSDFIRKLFLKLENDRVAMVATIPAKLRAGIRPVFDDIRNNVDIYADWYFSQWTTYRLLYVGLQAFAEYQLAPTAISAKEMAAAELNKYIHQHFQDVVLKPEINDYRMHKAFNTVFDNFHREFLRSLAAADQDFQQFVSARLPYARQNGINEPTLELDWTSNLNKLSMAIHDKGSIGALARGAASVSIGSKLVAPAIALTLASKKAVFALGTKLAAPLMTKLLTTVGASAAAGAVGAAAAGPAAPVAAPVMFVGGAALSLAADYLMNEADESRHRPAFVADVRGSVSAIEDEWIDLMKEPVDQALKIWYDDTINLLADYRK